MSFAMKIFAFCFSWQRSSVVRSPAQRHQSCWTCSPDLTYRWEANLCSRQHPRRSNTRERDYLWATESRSRWMNSCFDGGLLSLDKRHMNSIWWKMNPNDACFFLFSKQDVRFRHAYSCVGTVDQNIIIYSWQNLEIKLTLYLTISVILTRNGQ